jgi:hypothetical protein
VVAEPVASPTWSISSPGTSGGVVADAVGGVVGSCGGEEVPRSVVAGAGVVRVGCAGGAGAADGFGAVEAGRPVLVAAGAVALALPVRAPVRAGSGSSELTSLVSTLAPGPDGGAAVSG